MKAIAFVTQKGGSGKSTLCISLAVAAQQAGRSVCILEMDRQATVSDWAEHRHADTPEVAQIDATQLDDIMMRLRASDFDYVFIDTPGVDSPGSLAAIRAADLCVVPCRPTPADLRAFKPTLAAIYRLEKKFAFVLNQTRPAPIAFGTRPTVSPSSAFCRTSTSSCGTTTRMRSASARASQNIIRPAWRLRKSGACGAGSRSGRRESRRMSKPPKLSLASIVAAASPVPARQQSAEIVPISTSAPPAGGTNPRGTLKQRAKQLSVYLEPPVHDQLRDIAYTERTKIHQLMLEALDLLFKARGALSIEQLTKER